MKKVTCKQPSPEMQQKIKKARNAIASQKSRKIQCPACGHSSIIVFEDTRGHVQAKCSLCGKETVFDVLSMRKLRRRRFTK
jgi:transcription elongation factor Elf1